MPIRELYLTDVSNEEWPSVPHLLAPIRQNFSQRKHADLREVFDAPQCAV